MKEVWRKLSNLGITNDVPYHEARRIRLFNQIIFLAILTVLIFSLINFIQGKVILAYFELLMVALYASNIVISLQKKFELASILFFVEVYVFMAVLCIGFSPKRDLEYLILIIGIMPLTFYRNRIVSIGLYLLCFLLFIFAKISAYGQMDIVAYLNYGLFFVVQYYLVEYLKTEYENYQAQVEEQNKLLIELNEENKHLISIASHDLRSPLIRIQSLLSILDTDETKFSPEQKEIIALAQREARNQATMISEILDLYSLEDGKTVIKLEEVDLTKKLSDLVKSYQTIADKKNISIKFPITERFYCIGDKVYLKQVFENLLSNAVKFSYPNSNVFVSLQNKGKQISVTIKDEGQGLDEDDKKKLFIRFQRLSARPTSGESSTGLGLSIVKKYVEAMKGSIRCESEKGKGASFIVDLPKA